MSNAELRTETVGVELRSDLRELLDREAQHSGVTLSQYLREAAVARVIARRMLSDQDRFERVTRSVREAMRDDAVARSPHLADLVPGVMTRLTATEPRDESRAGVAQSEQAVRKMQELADRRTNGTRRV